MVASKLEEKDLQKAACVLKSHKPKSVFLWISVLLAQLGDLAFSMPMDLIEHVQCVTSITTFVILHLISLTYYIGMCIWYGIEQFIWIKIFCRLFVENTEITKSITLIIIKLERNTYWRMAEVGDDKWMMTIVRRVGYVQSRKTNVLVKNGPERQMFDSRLKIITNLQMCISSICNVPNPTMMMTMATQGQHWKWEKTWRREEERRSMFLPDVYEC